MHILFALVFAHLVAPAAPGAEPGHPGERVARAPLAQAPSAGEVRPEAGAGHGQVLIRVQGDAEVRSGQRVGLMVVVDGDARVQGTVDALAVIRGDAILEGARIGDMMVVQGRAVLGQQSVVAGDVNLRDANIETAPDAVVLGEVNRGAPAVERPSITIFGALIAVGIALAFILAGVLSAAVAPRGVRRAGRALTDEIGKTLLAAAVVWIAIPVLAGFALFTLVATPIGVALLAIALPALAVVGYLVAGIRVGDALLTTARRRTEIRPLAAAAAGLAILLGISLVPYLGPVINALAALVGGGAVGLILWRRARSVGEATA